MTTAFFEQEKVCPVCETKLKTTRVRSSACIVVKRDTDFCVYYKDINPLYYGIIICPECHYAALDKSFAEALKPAEKLRLQKGLQLLKKDEPDFAGERDVNAALRTVELAIQSAQIKQAGPGLIGSLFLRAAWFARELENTELENKYIDQARVLYKDSFEKERLAESRMPETRMMYIIGELHRRAGYYQEAVQWFSRVVTHRDIKKEPELERMARDQWDEAKQQFKEAQKSDTNNQDAAEELTVDSGEAQKEAAAAASPEVVVKKPPKIKRPQLKTSINFYNDQIEWLKDLGIKNYNKTKEHVETEVMIRAAMDVIKDLSLDIKEFTNESEFKEAILQAIRDKVKNEPES